MSMSQWEKNECHGKMDKRQEHDFFSQKKKHKQLIKCTDRCSASLIRPLGHQRYLATEVS